MMYAYTAKPDFIIRQFYVIFPSNNATGNSLVNEAYSSAALQIAPTDWLY